VKITNTGPALTSWRLGFTFPNGQTVQQGWSATWSQSGSTVTASNAAWNGNLGTGSSVDVGFNGSHSGTNGKPTGFTLNGVACG
jgi:cellulose 1,4-beta-cellobiosidase